MKIQIKSISDSVLFEHDCEDNTVAKTLEKAVSSGANLRGSNLRYSDLRYSDLRGSNLRDSDLRYSDLSGSDLRGSNLRGADLSGADLSGAYLRGAYFTKGKPISVIRKFDGLYKYPVCAYKTTDNELRIKMGCYDRSVSEWKEDFWNNPREFPNDESEKTRMRKFAFETALTWLNQFA
jgi:hypothetical protein